VGRFFMEHPHVLAGALLPSSAALSLDFYRARPAGRAQVAGYLTGSDTLRREERILAFSAFLAQDDVPLPDFERALAPLVREIDGREAEPARRAVFFMNELEQAPNPSSRVRLSDERDALGVPRVQLEWRLSGIDKLSIRRSHLILGRELGRAGLGRFQIMLSDDDHHWPPELGGGRHHMGTTRMHRDPRQGVVDPDGRVHGLANLYVAGSSVFPTSGAANPTLTVVALALRLADHLKART
jgi:choline dehydrogenase-like flavoprotein